MKECDAKGALPGESYAGEGDGKCYVIRELRDDETPLLKDFLYEAIFIPEGVEPPSKDIVELPELRVYTDAFGSGARDYCLVADLDGKPVGAVWSRIMDDYGHLDDDTPSLAIALYKPHRGHGLGTQLMLRMLDLLTDRGCRTASLAVQKANYAVRMYEKVGFRIVEDRGEEWLMRWEAE